jgi:hypothetical protein
LALRRLIQADHAENRFPSHPYIRYITAIDSRLPTLVRGSEPQENTNGRPDLPDGARREFPANISGLDIAKGTSPSLAKRTVAMALDGLVSDLSDPIEKDAKIEFISREDTRATQDCSLGDISAEKHLTTRPTFCSSTGIDRT